MGFLNCVSQFVSRLEATAFMGLVVQFQMFVRSFWLIVLWIDSWYGLDDLRTIGFNFVEIIYDS